MASNSTIDVILCNEWYDTDFHCRYEISIFSDEVHWIVNIHISLGLRGAVGSKVSRYDLIMLLLDLSIIPSYFDLMHLNLIIFILIQINYFLPSKRDNKCCLFVVLSCTILNHIETRYNEFTIVYSNVYLLEIPIFMDL